MVNPQWTKIALRAIFKSAIFICLVVNGYEIVDGTKTIVLELPISKAQNTLDTSSHFELVQLVLPVVSAFECKNGEKVWMNEPWTPGLAVVIRQAYADFASLLHQHTAVSFMDRLWISWTGELVNNEWRYLTDREPCWYSTNSKNAFRFFMNTHGWPVPPGLAPSEVSNTTEEYWHLVDRWYQTSLLDFGRMHLAIASQELAHVGVRLVVKFPAFPFPNAAWGYLAGYNGSTSLEQAFQVVSNFSNVDVWLPGIDPPLRPEFSQLVEQLESANFQVWTSFQTALTSPISPIEWELVHNALELYSMDGLVAMNSIELDGAMENLKNTQYVNPFTARKWYSLKIAAAVESADLVTFELVPNHLEKIPFQALVPSSFHAPQSWLDNHNGHFHFENGWKAQFLPRTLNEDIGIPGLDSTKKYWFWIGQVDCDRVAPTGHFYMMVNVTVSSAPTFELDDVYEMSCGNTHILNLQQHSMDRFLS